MVFVSKNICLIMELCSSLELLMMILLSQHVIKVVSVSGKVYGPYGPSLTKPVSLSDGPYGPNHTKPVSLSDKYCIIQRVRQVIDIPMD